jgi:hypothetical protein
MELLLITLVTVVLAAFAVMATELGVDTSDDTIDRHQPYGIA